MHRWIYSYSYAEISWNSGPSYVLLFTFTYTDNRTGLCVAGKDVRSMWPRIRCYTLAYIFILYQTLARLMVWCCEYMRGRGLPNKGIWNTERSFLPRLSLHGIDAVDVRYLLQKTLSCLCAFNYIYGLQILGNIRRNLRARPRPERGNHIEFDLRAMCTGRPFSKLSNQSLSIITQQLAVQQGGLKACINAHKSIPPFPLPPRYHIFSNSRTLYCDIAQFYVS